MDPNTWFNISRIFTLIGGVLTVLGGFGLYHFGKIKEINTNTAIVKSEENAALAQENAAKANQKTATLELEVSKSRKETALANQKTESFRLDIKRANRDAEESKLKAQELQLEVEKTKLEAEEARLEREKLMNQQRFIKSISVQVTVLLPTEKQEITKQRTAYPLQSLPLEKSPLEISKKGEYHIALFFLHNYSITQIEENLKQIKFNFGSPEMQEQIIGKDLSFLDGQLYVDCIWNEIINKVTFNKNQMQNSHIELKIIVNGIIAYSINFKAEVATNKIMSRLNFRISKEENNIRDFVLGNK